MLCSTLQLSIVTSKLELAFVTVTLGLNTLPTACAVHETNNKEEKEDYGGDKEDRTFIEFLYRRANEGSENLVRTDVGGDLNRPAGTICPRFLTVQQ
ncbi:hypothetical protein RRG08_019684 [Elysia crispata]|uniref:Uncharacterized protein n=1 Tax=Elysia crispata TaxID=231223 RepID=A0AAE0YX00_9GAST|nr:hypothetical protein RRG08_019684 [Elysia crispata]